MPTFVLGNVPPAPAALDARWFLFVGHELVVRDAGAAAELARPASLPETVHYLGTLDGRPCFTARITAAPEGAHAEGLRALFNRIPDVEWSVAGRALQVLEWDRTHRFCGACGRETTPVATERSRRCEGCAINFYPRVAPAMIILIHRGEEALLARSKASGGRFHSTLAGFVEPGESLEECVHREVLEEVGVTVKNLRYFGSQPWPFPHSLMLGFHAEWESGELKIDESELIDAGWFRYDALPVVPPKISIAGKLIDAWRRQHVK